MDVVTLKLASAELRDFRDKWRTIGCELDVGGLHNIGANHVGDDERCLSDVLNDWIRNGNPSWIRLCKALENIGLQSKAQQIKEKYCKPSIPGTRTTSASTSKAKSNQDKSISPSTTPTNAGESENYILLRDRKVETIAWSIPGVYSKKAENEISRGELLVRKGDLLYTNESAAFGFHSECQNVAPLESAQWNLLRAIPTPKGRFLVFMTVDWMDWGTAVKKGDEVYIRVMKDGVEYCSTAVVHYIGTMAGDQPGTMFGVEITDSRYYGCGTSDGTFNKIRYFTCPDNNGLFLSLALVAKCPEWLKLEYRPKRDIPAVTEGMPKDHNNEPAPAKRSTKEPPRTSASLKIEVNRANVISSKLPHGTRVIIKKKDGRKIKGTVRWAGELPLEGEDPKKKIPVYGVETDISISYEHIQPVVALKGRPQFGASTDHGRVFIPQTMVEEEQVNCWDTTEKIPSGTKDIHKEAGVDNDGKSQAALKEQAALAQHLGSEIAKETSIEDQMKIMQGIQKAKQRGNNSAPDKGVLAGKEAGVNIEESRPADLKFEREKAAIAQDLGTEIAEDTNIEEQMRIMEGIQKAKQRDDNAAPDKGVLAGGSSAESQYLAFPQIYPHSNSQLGRQSGYTQDFHQYNHTPSLVVPAQDGLQHVGIGSAVVISNSDPQVCGTVRWIGTIPQVNGLLAGVELELPMEGCTDGYLVQSGERFFVCPPHKGYFCLLEQLVPIFNNPMNYIPEEMPGDGRADSSLFDRYIGDQKGIQGHQNSCYLDATLFGLFALSSCFDKLFLCSDSKDNQSIDNIIWKKIVNPLRSHGAARYESVMALRERLEDLGKMKGITKDEKDPEEFLNMLFKHVLHPEPFIEIRRPYGIEAEFFVQLFLESEAAKSDAVPTISDMIHRMFTEQQLLFTKAPQRLLIQVPRFGKQFKTYKRVIPSRALNVSKLVHTDEDGFCSWCDSPAEWTCKECTIASTSKDLVRVCTFCSERRHKSIKYKGHNPVAIPKREDVELELLSVICIETSHYVCFTRANDKWLFFDSMANRVGDKYNIPRCTDCTREINGWVYDHSLKLLSADLKPPELVRRFTQDVYMCVYVVIDADLYE